MSNIQECQQLQILFKLKNEFISLVQVNVQSNVQVIIRLRFYVSIGNVIPNDFVDLRQICKTLQNHILLNIHQSSKNFIYLESGE